MESSANAYYIVEQFIIISVIIIQIFITFKLIKKINVFQSIFTNKIKIVYGFINRKIIGQSINVIDEIIFDEERAKSIEENSNVEFLKVPVIDNVRGNSHLKNIRKSINLYLINNFGAVVNFSIVKDIIDREVDIVDEDISQSIPIPLYLGLAATMIGIIFGLLAMPEISNIEIPSSGETGTDSIGFGESIFALINGVKFAMSASLVGLLCTTIISSFVYKNAKRQVMNEKNEQISYLQATLLPELIKAEESGMSGLKSSLDKFARDAKKISEGLLNSVNQTSDNLKAQLVIIDKVERLNMTKVSKANLELFDRIDNSVYLFNNFTQHLSKMDLISNNLAEFTERTKDIELIASGIKESIANSNELMRFVSTHINHIQNFGEASLQIVDKSDAHFRDAIEKLTIETNKRIDSLNALTDSAEANLYDMTEKHLLAFSAAYEKSVPQFSQLDNLKILPEIREKTDFQTKQLVQSLDHLNSQLKESIKRSDDLYKKLDGIQKGQKRRGSDSLTGISEETEKLGFFNKIKKRLRFKSKKVKI